MDKILTIIIPVYNTEKYLEKCLNSLIIKRNLLKLEVLVIIDGSPDNSLYVAKPFENQYPDIFRIIDKKNGGHGSCCNLGISEAKGIYLKILDSDDWVDTESLDNLLDHLLTTPADIIFTRTWGNYTYKSDEEIDSISGISFDKIYKVEEFSYKTLSTSLFTLSRSTFKVELLRKSGIYFRENTSYDDTIIAVMGAVGVKTMVFYNMFLYHYRIGHPGQSMAMDINAKRISIMCDNLKDIIGAYSKNKDCFTPPLKKYLLDIIWGIVCNLYSNAYALEYSFSKPLVRQINKHFYKNKDFSHLKKTKLMLLDKFLGFSFTYLVYHFYHKLVQ